MNTKQKRINKALEEFNKKSNSNYRIVKAISEEKLGAFASVFEVKNGKGEIEIMKAIDTKNVKEDFAPKIVWKYTKAEIESLKAFKDCEYIMDVTNDHDYTFDEASYDHVYLIFMPKMEMSLDYFKKNDYDLREIIKMGKDISLALDACAQKKLIHRDVKPNNIFYSSKLGHFVLGDFGTSRVVREGDKIVTCIGTLNYIAPEIAHGLDLHNRLNADLYSLGLCMILLYSKMAISRDKIQERLKYLPAEIREVFLKANEFFPEKRYQTARELYNDLVKVEKLLALDEKKIPYAQACADEFEKGNYQKALEIAKEGHEQGYPKLSCMYAYLLICKKETDKALEILRKTAVSDRYAALGLYGIFSHMEAVKYGDNNYKPEYIEMVIESATHKFSIATYFIGRWMVDGQFGFDQNLEDGFLLLSDSATKGFIVATDYIRKSIERHSDELKSIEPIIDLLNTELDGFTEKDYPKAFVWAIANA